MFRRPGLDAAEASRLCRAVCGARCCQGPQVLMLAADEIAPFAAAAARIGVTARLRPRGDGAALRFPDHPGDRCPMLAADDTCRAYDARPGRCRAFPEGPRAGCVISGDVPDDDPCAKDA